MKKKLIISTTDSVTLATILKGVPKYLNQFFEVKLVGSPGPDVDRIVAAEGVPLEGIRMTRQVTPLADLEALRQLYAYFKRERPDIVHSYTPKAGLLCMMAAAAVGVPHRVHSILGLPMMETQGAMRAIFSVTERVTYLCATHLISIGPGLRDYIHQHLTRKPLHLIGDGGMKNVDMDWFRDEFDTGAKQRIRADLKLAPTDFVVAYVGRIVRDKGIVELVDAVVEVYDRHPSVRLLLVGIHDEARDVLPAQTRRLIDSHPAIRMRGWTWDIRPSFAAADV